ncbi:hypothetical protein [Streptomyces pinistramenti]|uniref:hypothetical protein n=1 Tax=Streptomyces pinistramenti TaxID=2884812 RepID=UPI001D08A8C1|nr:hypothetical protein [Streptomyces pinistramenti]MCB5910061.1 hypothetical protein [Streptomyces pinistramenti]
MRVRSHIFISAADAPIRPGATGRAVPGFPITARTLGSHTDVAVARQRLSEGGRAHYDAEVSRRRDARDKGTVTPG